LDRTNTIEPKTPLSKKTQSRSPFIKSRENMENNFNQIEESGSNWLHLSSPFEFESNNNRFGIESSHKKENKSRKNLIYQDDEDQKSIMVPKSNKNLFRGKKKKINFFFIYNFLQRFI
jgi:hypothetical protein